MLSIVMAVSMLMMVANASATVYNVPYWWNSCTASLGKPYLTVWQNGNFIMNYTAANWNAAVALVSQYPQYYGSLQVYSYTCTKSAFFTYNNGNLYYDHCEWRSGGC